MIMAAHGYYRLPALASPAAPGRWHNQRKANMTRQRLTIIRMHLMMAGAALLFGWQASAAEGDTTTITINGTLIDGPQCVIDGNNTVDVKFGDDLITRLVDGVNYKKEIQYGLTCTGLNSNALKLTIRGSLASFGGFC
jgi:hypothetical protein